MVGACGFEVVEQRSRAFTFAALPVVRVSGGDAEDLWGFRVALCGAMQAD